MTRESSTKVLRTNAPPIDKLAIGLAEVEQAERDAVDTIINLEAACAAGILDDDARREKLTYARDRREDAAALRGCSAIDEQTWRRCQAGLWGTQLASEILALSVSVA